jgi:transposase
LESLPDVSEKIAFDKFHVAKYLGEAVDKVRRQERKALMAEGYEDLKGSKYDWLYNPEKMTRQ